MRLLHVIPTINKKFGGPVHALDSFLDVDRKLNIQSEIITTTSENEFHYGDIQVHSFKSSFPSRLSKSKPANNWLKTNYKNYDFAIFHGVWTYLHFDLAKICKDYDLPYAVRPHSTLDPKDLEKKKYLKKLFGPLYVKPYLEGAHKVICTAQPELDRIVTYGVEISPVIVPLPIKPASYPDDYNSASNKKEIRFLFLSRIDYKKGLDLFLKAMGGLEKEQRKRVKLDIAGDGKPRYKRKIRQLIKENDLEKQVTFLGFVTGEEKEKAFQNSDVFILTSYFENFGYAVVEALDREVPVFISKEVDIWKDIQKYDAGWFCEYNVESIKKKLQEILLNGEINKKRRNTSSAAKQFYIENIVDKYKKIFD